EAPNTNRDFLFSKSKAFKTATKFFVFGDSKLKSSNTTIDFSFALILKADFLAKRFKFLFNLKPQFLGLGPNIRPPPLKTPDLIDPALAVPVSFCFLILRVLPEISALSLALCVPCLWFARYCLTSKYTAWLFGSIAYTSLERSTFLPVSFPFISKTATFITY